MSRGLVVLALVLSLTVGISDASAHPLTGTPVTKPFASGGKPFGLGATATVAIEPTSCTGVIVEPRIVITAAHCVLDEQTDRPINSREFVVLGPGANFKTHSSEFAVGVQQVLTGEFRYAQSYYFESDDFWTSLTSEQVVEVLGTRLRNAAEDFAVLVLSHPLPIAASVNVAGDAEITALATARPESVIVGYGTGDSVNVSDTPDAVSGTFYSADTIPFQIEDRLEWEPFWAWMSVNSGVIAFQANSPMAGICEGDSGGPLVASIDGGLLVLGVVSEAGDSVSCEDRRGEEPVRQWVGVAGGSKLVALLGEARALVSNDPVKAGICETGQTVSDDEWQECRLGSRWATVVCSAETRLTLEQFTKNRWRTVKPLRGVADPKKCPKSDPYAFTMPRTSPLGGASYRLRYPQKRRWGKYEAWISVNRFQAG